MQGTLDVAAKYLGVAEAPAGAAPNPTILKFQAVVHNPADDEVPWCAAFANDVLSEAGIEGTNKPNARSFMDWGVETDNPEPGDIVVFWRGDPNGWQGHVAFFVEFLEGALVRVLGGNQHDSVCYANFPTARVLGYRRAA
jgi:uncharacterized protein (TIGR02594 family)